MDDSIINEITQSVYRMEKEGPDLNVEKALHPTSQSGRALYNLKKQRRENKMTQDYGNPNPSEVELEDWEREQFRENMQKWNRFMQEETAAQAQQRQQHLYNDAYKEVAQELDMSPEEMTAFMNDQDPYEAETFFKERLKDYLKGSVARSRRNTQRPRDSAGRFVSTQPDRQTIEQARENKDPDAMINALLPDSDPLFR